MRTIASTTINTATKTSLSPTPSVSQTQPQPQLSPWHSPVPYLFGGLAAMLGLIAFALLILACSYWKLAGQLDEREEERQRDRDLESGGEKEAGDNENKVVKVYEEKFLVIMAGDQKPTYLATPMCPKAVSFGDENINVKGENKETENCESIKKEMDDHDQSTTEETRDSSETPETQDQSQ